MQVVVYVYTVHDLVYHVFMCQVLRNCIALRECLKLVSLVMSYYLIFNCVSFENSS